MIDTTSSEKELDALEISERLDVAHRTIQNWLAKRRDIFPNARKLGPSRNSLWVTLESDVLEYERKYPKRK